MAENNTEAKSSDHIGLDDDKPLNTPDFNGATLQIGGNDQQDGAVPSDETETEVRVAGTGISRNRPGSVVGRTSVRSTTSSRTSMKPGLVQSDIAAKSYYCYKEDQLDKAVESCKHIIKPDLDGEYKQHWLLTEIDHWDLEREKIVILTKYSVFIVKYNFINETMIEYKRILLHIINTISVGDFKYPNSSVMPDRQHGGIKLSWSRGEELTFGQRWNPWCSDIPWTILAHHPVLYHPRENETATFNVDEFFETLVMAISKAYTEKRPGENLTVIEGPVVIEAYISPVAMVFNQSGIGFFRDRNGVSF